MYLYMLYIQFAIKKKNNPLYLGNLDRVYYNTLHCQVAKKLPCQPTIGAQRDGVNQHPAAFSSLSLRMGSCTNMP